LKSEALHVSRLRYIPEAHADDHPEEAERAALLDHVDRQLASIQVVPAPEREQLHAVFVVADEEAGRSIGTGPTFRRDGEPPPRKVLEHAKHRRHHGYPLG